MFEIGTSPYFSNVAPGEVTELPPDSSQQRVLEGYEDAVDIRRPVYPGVQQVEYPPYEPEGQVLVHTVQFQPQHVDFPGNPEVVVVDDGDINVDGESTGGGDNVFSLLVVVDFSPALLKCFSARSPFLFH